MTWLLAWRERVGGSWWGRILAEHDTEPAELSGAALKMAIGAWLLVPFGTFASSRSFEVFSILPEWAWGTVLIGLGAFHLAALRSGGQLARRHASTIGYLVWFTFALVFVSSNPPAIGWLAFLMAGLAQLWCSLRLGGRRA